MTDIINKIVWQTPDNEKSWVYALCPLLGNNMVSFQVQGGYRIGDGGTPTSTQKAERDEVARRLVACWNACAGTDTEVLERLPPLTELIAQDKGRSHKAEIERDQLLAALQSIDTRLRECSKHPISAAEAYDSFYQEVISTAIAACQPAPAVARLASDETEGGAA